MQRRCCAADPPTCVEETGWQVHDLCDGTISDGCVDKPDPVEDTLGCAGRALLAAQRRVPQRVPSC